MVGPFNSHCCQGTILVSEAAMTHVRCRSPINWHNVYFSPSSNRSLTLAYWEKIELYRKMKSRRKAKVLSELRQQ